MRKWNRKCNETGANKFLLVKSVARGARDQYVAHKVMGWTGQAHVRRVFQISTDVGAKLCYLHRISLFRGGGGNSLTVKSDVVCQILWASTS